jgi:hypothetical protein
LLIRVGVNRANRRFPATRQGGVRWHRGYRSPLVNCSRKTANQNTSPGSNRIGGVGVDRGLGVDIINVKRSWVRPPSPWRVSFGICRPYRLRDSSSASRVTTKFLRSLRALGAMLGGKSVKHGRDGATESMRRGLVAQSLNKRRQSIAAWAEAVAPPSNPMVGRFASSAHGR